MIADERTRRNIRLSERGQHTWTVRAATVVALLGIARATLYPTRESVPPGFAICLPCGEFGTLDFLLNVALFVPFGALLAVQGSRRAIVVRVTLISFLVSLAIEVAQLVAINGRDPSLADVVANTAGGMAGALAVTLVPRLWRGGQAVWWGMTWLWVFVSAGMLTLGSWAVAMFVPPATYFVQWEPIRPNHAPFTGRLMRLSLHGLELPSGAVLAPNELPGSFFAGRAWVWAELVPGDRTLGTALIARLVLASGEFLTLARAGDALVVRYLTNAQRLGLRSPSYALDDAFANEPDANVALEVRTRPGVLQLRTTSATASPERIVRVSGARFWATLLPFVRGFGALGTLGDVLWLGALFLPAAYGASRAHRLRIALLAPLVLAAVTLTLTLAYDRALGWWPFWLSIGMATAVGLWLGRRRARRAEQLKGAELR